MKTLFNHRSIRNFKPDAVDDETLNYILTAGTRASTIGTMQMYSMVVSTRADIKEQLSAAHFKQPMVNQAPVIITFCADSNRFSKWCKQRGGEPGYDNFLWYIFGATDALLASQNVALAAESKGLGICYLGTTNYMADTIIDILKLPLGVVPVTTLVIGYPNEQPDLTPRLPLDAVVHYETYSDFTPSQIDDLYAELETSEQTQNLLKINEKENLALVFTENRYKKADSMLFSNRYFEALKKQGFMNQ